MEANRIGVLSQVYSCIHFTIIYITLHKVTDAFVEIDVQFLLMLTSAQRLRLILESGLFPNCTGLYLNETKTECMPINTRNNIQIKTLSNNILKCVEDYKYLGSHILNSEKDFNIRKGMAWNACNKMDKLWKSSLSRNIKIRLFRVTIEPILLYGSETWTLSARQHRRLDGCYTRLLRRVLNRGRAIHP